MDIDIQFYRRICGVLSFMINGVPATYEDFGDKYDRNPEAGEKYGCGDMRFTVKEATSKILDKYNITEEEYHEIADLLTDKLSFGECSLCV